MSKCVDCGKRLGNIMARRCIPCKRQFRREYQDKRRKKFGRTDMGLTPYEKHYHVKLLWFERPNHTRAEQFPNARPIENVAKLAHFFRKGTE